MNESLAAVIVAVVTGGFGFLGILVTQWLSRAKAKKMGDENKIIPLGTTPPGMTEYMGNVIIKVRENGIQAREGIQAVKERLSVMQDNQSQMKRELAEIKWMLERLERRDE